MRLQFIMLTAGAVLFYVIFLLMLMPASRLLGLISLPNWIEVSQIQGTLWQGQIQHLILAKQQPLTLSWRPEFRQWYPVLAIQLKNQTDTQGSLFLRHSSGWLVQQFRLQLPATEVFDRLPFPASAKGVFNIYFAEFLFQQKRCQHARGFAEWHDASLTLPGHRFSLDNVTVNLSCHQGVINAEIDQSSASLSINGSGQLQPDGRYRFKGVLAFHENVPSHIENALKKVAERDTQGQYHFEGSGKWDNFSH